MTVGSPKPARTRSLSGRTAYTNTLPRSARKRKAGTSHPDTRLIPKDLAKHRIAVKVSRSETRDLFDRLANADADACENLTNLLIGIRTVADNDQ